MYTLPVLRQAKKILVKNLESRQGTMKTVWSDIPICLTTYREKFYSKHDKLDTLCEEENFKRTKDVSQFSSSSGSGWEPGDSKILLPLLPLPVVLTVLLAVSFLRIGALILWLLLTTRKKKHSSKILILETLMLETFWQNSN